jgi:hypothetical protein
VFTASAQLYDTMLPPGLSTADNEVGWLMSLAKLAALVETG